MLTFAVTIYFKVALIGIYLFTKLFSKNPPKMLVGIIHGALGLFGIGLLIFYISFSKGDTPVESVLLFLSAFLIGGGMLVTRLSGKKFPKWIPFIHIAVAVTGIYFLVSFWLR